MKIRNKYIFAVALSGCLAFTSCNDMLDVDYPSQSDVAYVFSNTDDAQTAINGVYVKFCEDPFTSRMSNVWMQNTDVEVMCPNEGNPNSAHRSDLWGLQSACDVSFADIYKAWNNNLEAIELANNVIIGCEKSAIANDAELQQIKGEAVCLKAWRYLMLCNFWGDVPLYSEASKFGDELDKPRTDKNIIFSSCLQQLVNCEGSMKWSDTNTGGTERCTRDFALGLIAKMALFRAGYGMTADGTMKRADDYLDVNSNEALAVTYKDLSGNEKVARTSKEYYELAKNYCQKLIQLKGRQLRSNYRSIFEEQENYMVVNNDEILYQVAFVANRGGDVGWCIGVTNTGGCHNGTTTNQVGIHPVYYMSFADNDVRRDVTCSRYSHDNDTIKVPEATGMNVAKWDRYNATKELGSSSSKGTGINWTLMRYSEVLLMLAEAENELNGPTALAKEQLTKVRARAFSASPSYDKDVTAYVDSVATSKEKFFNAIVDERAWEFGGECVRKWDLARWNIYGQKINETLNKMNAWGIAITPELMERPELIPNYYAAAKECAEKGWANILYYTKPLKTKDKNDIAWVNSKYACTDSLAIPNYYKVNWGAKMIKKVTTYLYDGKEYTKAPTKTTDKEAGTVKYVFEKGPEITVNSGEETGIEKKVIYQSSDWAARLYRGYTGENGQGTGAVPYLMPVGTTTLTSSTVLDNTGYGFDKTYTGPGKNVDFATLITAYK